MTIIDRTAETDAVFAARLARMESRPPVDLAADVAEERVARAICLAAYNGEPEWIWDRMGSPLRDDYLRLARAALSAVPPADEARERKLARLRELAEQWATLTHWDYKGSPKVAEARAQSANDAARIVLNVLDGGDLL